MALTKEKLKRKQLEIVELDKQLKKQYAEIDQLLKKLSKSPQLLKYRT